MSKKIILGSLMLLSSFHINNRVEANCCSQEFCCPCSDWYGIVGTGYAWSLNTGIDNPDPSFWDPAVEGYDANLGNSPFFTLGVGTTFCNMFCLDIDYTFYQTFHYQKFQTGTAATPGFTGPTRTRFFDLDHQNVLANFSYYSNCFSYTFGCAHFTPFVGVGIGVGINRVSNFHTVGFDADAAVGSTTSIGRSVTKAAFAWQATAGIEVQPNSCSALSIDIGYHYYSGGRFEGPSSIVINTDADPGVILSGAPWKGRLKAHELFVTLNFHI